MGFDIGQPGLMAGSGVMAVFATAHRALVFGRQIELGALSTGEVVVRPTQILVDLERARVVAQMGGIVALGLAQVRRIVQGVVAIGALQLALCMDIPGLAQFALAGQIHTRGIDALRGNHLAGGGGLRIVEITGADGQGLVGGRVHLAMTGGAVGVGRILDGHQAALQLTLLIEGGGVPGPALSGGLDDVQA